MTGGRRHCAVPVGGVTAPYRSAASLRRTGRRRASAGRPPGDRWFCPTVGICLPGSGPSPRTPSPRARTLLAGLARDADIFELVSELAPLHPRDNTFPGEVFLRLAAGALDWCGASRADPLPLEGLRERFLPERTFRGRQNTKLQYAVLAAAALHGGTEPDLLDEVAWHRLAEIKAPVTVACGDLDVPFLADRCRLLADRLPTARHHVLAGLAHQPYLESASTVAQLIRSAVTGG